jgi:hypothetical protein
MEKGQLKSVRTEWQNLYNSMLIEILGLGLVREQVSWLCQRASGLNQAKGRILAKEREKFINKI